jgi:hypothetical protein
MEVNMFPLASVGPSELAVLAGVTALACGLPLVSALVVTAILLRQKDAFPLERE